MTSELPDHAWKNMLVVAIDVGSPAKMGWAMDGDISGCGAPDVLVTRLSEAVWKKTQIAIGFESPLWVPRGRDFARMTASRGGVEAKMSRAWSAGAGCGALASGVANMAWVFDALHEACGSIACTTLPDRFASGEAQMLVWEAFVSGAAKSDSHHGDAELAVQAFRRHWPNVESAITIEPSVNLAAAALTAAGHGISHDEIGRSGIVVAALS